MKQTIGLTLVWLGGFAVGFAVNGAMAGELKVEPLDPAPAYQYSHGFYGGLGVDDSDGSGSMQAEQMIGPWKILAQVWTDNDQKQFVLQERRTPKATRVLEVQGGDSSNVALAGAYCGEFAKYYRGCGGLAYLTEDDTDTVDDHLALYWELGGYLPKAPKWRAFIAGYGDDELFIMGGRTFR